jgi:hypothetical protein
MAGEYPGDATVERAEAKLARILDSGVSAFLDLTAPEDGLLDYHPLLPERGFVYRRTPIRDMDVPTPSGMRHILKTLEELLFDQVVYVHCWGGIGRTGTVVGCHLVEHHGMNGQQALETIAGHWNQMAKRRRFPRSPQTEAQCQFVRSWVRGLSDGQGSRHLDPE